MAGIVLSSEKTMDVNKKQIKIIVYLLAKAKC
jgi:hypothetical protein